MDRTGHGLGDQCVVDREGAVGNGNCAAAVRGRRAEREGSLVDNRAAAIGVVACESKTARAALDQSYGACAVGDHGGNRGGVGIDVSEQLRSAGGDGATAEPKCLIGRHEKTARADGQGVCGSDRDGGSRTRVDPEGVDGPGRDSRCRGGGDEDVVASSACSEKGCRIGRVSRARGSECADAA